jgi:hypothetical protein
MFKKKSPSEMDDIGSRRYTPKNICASARRNVVLIGPSGANSLRGALYLVGAWYSTNILPLRGKY